MLAHSLVVFWQVHDALMRPDLPRGTVTFLFTDIEGSTRLLRRLGPELYAEALAAHRQLLYFVVEVAPKGGPPLHVHHIARGNDPHPSGPYKIRIGEETFHCGEGAFAYLPSGVPHAFLNTTDDPGEIIVVYTPGGGHKFYEGLGPLTRNGTPDRVAVAAVFEKYDMTLLGPPITDD